MHSLAFTTLVTSIKQRHSWVILFPAVRHSAVPPHVKECFLSPDRDLELLLPGEVSDCCLYINFSHEEKTFICDLPNKIERD
ncbi:hypothetical protein MRX96_049458 [Rhipicephalus microplus]